jgi:Bacterial alpha-L-rhamnosidase C-terminal domain
MADHDRPRRDHRLGVVGGDRRPRRAYDSLNQYSKGAAIDFLHRYTAGIRLTDSPAYRSFVIEPVPGGGLTAASAAHESPYGRSNHPGTSQQPDDHCGARAPWHNRDGGSRRDRNARWLG